MCTLYFPDGSHFYLHLYTKTIFARGLYINKIKNTQSCLHTDFESQILRSLLSNEKGILHFWKKSIIQYLQNCAQIY